MPRHTFVEDYLAGAVPVDAIDNTAMSNIRIEAIDPASAAIFRRKTEAERLQIAWGMWRSARAMLLNLMRAEHPDWSDAQISREVARRLSHGAV